jgi:WhiB family redox-sensing transcriptional regulator
MQLINEVEFPDMKRMWDAMDQADEPMQCESFPDAFFPEQGTPGDSRESLWAKQMCAECPISKLCAEYAIIHGITEGIWGGTTPRQRQTIRRLRSMP